MRRKLVGSVVGSGSHQWDDGQVVTHFVGTIAEIVGSISRAELSPVITPEAPGGIGLIKVLYTPRFERKIRTIKRTPKMGGILGSRYATSV